jgi:imidazolonepropionase-like amidohydrolase
VPRAAPPDPALAITHVAVVDVEHGRLLADRTVLVRAGRIAAVGAAAAVVVPAGARVVDGRGRFLMPGLWDMHVHAARDGRARFFWPLLVAHGVTGAREMGSYLDSLLHYRAAAAGRPGDAPRIVWSSPMLDGVPAAWAHAYGVADPAAARTAVDSMQALGFAFLKVYDRLSPEAYFAIAEQARRRGLPFAGHVPRAVSAVQASDAGQRSLEHLPGMMFACHPPAAGFAAERRAAAARHGADSDSARAAQARLYAALVADPDPEACAAVMRRLAKNGTWWTPTLVLELGRRTADDPRLRAVPPALAARWRAGLAATTPEDAAFDRDVVRSARAVVRIARDAGVPLLAGTDASDEPFVYPGASLHDELALLVASGLTPAQALRAATLEPARYLNAADTLGTVAAGRVADLVLLDADPLRDIAHTRRIRAVVYRGRWIDGPERARLLALGEAAAARARVAPPARR